MRNMRKKSVLLRSAASGAIVLGALAATLPANAAALPSSTASTYGSISAGSLAPASVGSILCTGNLCIQRITSVVNGRANVKAWANTLNFTGYFVLTRGATGQSPTHAWIAGGTGYVFTNLPAGVTLEITERAGIDILGVQSFGF